MVFLALKKTLRFVPNKVSAINKTINSTVNLNDKVDRTFSIVTKVSGVTTGAAGVAKGTVDFAEAMACSDGVCATVSAVGVVADVLQVCASFVPGPNLTVMVTIPTSVACKVFVWCCKRSSLPWGGC